MDSLSHFEMLPDELLLHICHYLHTVDVLYSFHNLNARLNVTTTGYCRYLDLSGTTCPRFNYVVSNILPQIAPFVESFVFHAYRDNFWSAKIPAFFDVSHLSSLFPRLRTITLHWFTSQWLLSFIEKLPVLLELKEVNIRCLKGVLDNKLLTEIFGANDCRLNTITFDSLSKSLDVPEANHPFSYANIQKLTVNIRQGRMLARLFALIPCIQCLQVNVEEFLSKSNFAETFINLSPLTHLIDFHLSSVGFWNLDEINAIIRQMPSLQIFTLDISTRDELFIKREHFLQILPSSLKQIHFLIRYFFLEVTFEVNSLVTSWAVSLPINCLVDESYGCLLVFTTLAAIQLLNLPATVSKQILPGCKYTQRINDLFIFGATSLIDILSTVQHFRRLRKLEIDAKNMSETCKYVCE